MPTLLVQLPGLPPVSHIVRDETTTIGRMKSNSIVIDDSSVSLMHAKITRNKDGEYYLKDLNSTNGTRVNGQTIAEAKLKDQDQVSFAEVSTQYLAEPRLDGVTTPSSTQAAAAPIPVQVLGLVAGIDGPKSAPTSKAAATAGSVAESLSPVPPGGTTLVRVRERPVKS